MGISVGWGDIYQPYYTYQWIDFTGLPAGARAKSPLIKCPADTAPAAGKHCDSVKGAVAYGEGTLPVPTGPMPAAKSQ